MRSTLLLVSALLLMTQASGRAAENNNTYSNVGLGTFSGRALTFHNLLRPHDIIGAPGSRNDNALSATISLAYGNISVDDPLRYVVDGEWLFADVELSYQISDVLSFGAYIPFSSRDGGFMDSGIENFHDALGIGQQGRERQGKDEVNISVTDGETTYSETDSSSGINDIPFFVNWHITAGDESYPSLTIQPRVTLPTGDEDNFEGLGTVSYGIAAVLAKRLGRSRHHLYATADYSYGDADEINGFILKDGLIAGSLAWEYRYSPRTSLLCQYQVVSGLTENLKEWSQEAHHLTLGAKRRINTAVSLEVGMQQNMFRYENSTDVAFRFALTGLF